MEKPKQSWRGFTILIILILLLMILMRMVWMQRREYTPILDMRTAISVLILEHTSEDYQANNERLQVLWPVLSKKSYTSRDLQLLKWYVTPGYKWIISNFQANQKNFAMDKFIKNNQNLVLATVFFSVLAARFLSGSWLLSIMVAAMLLSRGRLIAGIGNLSSVCLINMMLTLWFCAVCHHIRTVSQLSFCLMAMVLLGLVLIDPVFMGLSALFPICLIGIHVLRRFMIKPIEHGIRRKIREMKLLQEARHERIYENEHISELARIRFFYSFLQLFGMGRAEHGSVPQTSKSTWLGGGALQPISISFFLWIYRKKQWKKQTMRHVGVAFIIIFSALVGLSWPCFGYPYFRVTSSNVYHFIGGDGAGWLFLWLIQCLQNVDLDLYMALIVLILSFFIPNVAGLSNFRETSGVFLIAIALLMLFAVGWDWLDIYYGLTRLSGSYVVPLNVSSRGASLFIWLDPILLTMGAIGAFHLVKNSWGIIRSESSNLKRFFRKSVS